MKKKINNIDIKNKKNQILMMYRINGARKDDYQYCFHVEGSEECFEFNLEDIDQIIECLEELK